MKRCAFKFHKVVRQQNSGAVEDFILPYSAVYLRIQKWKNYWNRSTFATQSYRKNKSGTFLWPKVYTCIYSWLAVWLNYLLTQLTCIKTTKAVLN